MNDPRRELSKKIADFLESHGIDPLFAANIIIILYAISYWKLYKNWDKAPAIKKRSAIITLIAAIVCTIGSILKIILVY